MAEYVTSGVTQNVIGRPYDRPEVVMRRLYLYPGAVLTVVATPTGNDSKRHTSPPAYAAGSELIIHCSYDL